MRFQGNFYNLVIVASLEVTTKKARISWPQFARQAAKPREPMAKWVTQLLAVLQGMTETDHVVGGHKQIQANDVPYVALSPSPSSPAGNHPSSHSPPPFPQMVHLLKENQLSHPPFSLIMPLSIYYVVLAWAKLSSRRSECRHYCAGITLVRVTFTAGIVAIHLEKVFCYHFAGEMHNNELDT